MVSSGDQLYCRHAKAGKGWKAAQGEREPQTSRTGQVVPVCIFGQTANFLGKANLLGKAGGPKTRMPFDRERITTSIGG
jgi:hypothetical protein